MWWSSLCEGYYYRTSWNVHRNVWCTWSILVLFLKCHHTKELESKFQDAQFQATRLGWRDSRYLPWTWTTQIQSLELHVVPWVLLGVTLEQRARKMLWNMLWKLPVYPQSKKEKPTETTIFMLPSIPVWRSQVWHHLPSFRAY